MRDERRRLTQKRITGTMTNMSKGRLLERIVPSLVVVSVLLAAAVGYLFNEVGDMKKDKTPNVANNNVAGNEAAAPEGKLTEDQAKKVPPVDDKDHIKGSKDADIVIVEYSDFECPFCEAFHPTAKQALAEYGDKIAWVYRYFPLDSIHPRARPSANAAECVASLKGNDAFWKFADLVFSNQEKYLTDAGLSEAAVTAGVQKGAFESCYKADEFDSVVSSDQQGGEAAGITGTPGSFIINKKGEMWLIPGAVPYDSLKSSIEEALKS